jgi:aryl-alcohol dehydrogenase-like predicted oxidoreductase
VTMPTFALRWILDHKEVSCVIPGARNSAQVLENIKAAEAEPLGPSQSVILANIYQNQIRPLVHQRW